MVKAKFNARAENKERTGNTGGSITGRWSWIGLGTCTVIIMFCRANLGHFKSANLSSLMLLNESAMRVVSSITNINSTRTPLSSFCQQVYQAQEFLEPVNEPRRKMAHVFVANSGHLPLLRNSLVSIQQLPTPWTSLVFAVDAKLCPDLHQQSPTLKVECIDYSQRLLQQMERDEPVFYNAYLNKSAKELTLNETATWNSEMHKVLINSKLYGLRDILHCGLDVFLTDVDIVFLKDPRPYFAGEDIIAQNDNNIQNYKLNMNSGFMYWRQTARNLNLSHALVKDTVWWQIDQVRVNELLWARGINVTILNTTQFPNGAILYGLKDNPLSTDTVAVHANWNDHFDQKKEILTKHQLWLID
jgi:hypothetical protein